MNSFGLWSIRKQIIFAPEPEVDEIIGQVITKFLSTSHMIGIFHLPQLPSKIF